METTSSTNTVICIQCGPQAWNAAAGLNSRTNWKRYATTKRGRNNTALFSLFLQQVSAKQGHRSSKHSSSTPLCTLINPSGFELLPHRQTVLSLSFPHSMKTFFSLVERESMQIHIFTNMWMNDFNGYESPILLAQPTQIFFLIQGRDPDPNDSLDFMNFQPFPRKTQLLHSHNPLILNGTLYDLRLSFNILASLCFWPAPISAGHTDLDPALTFCSHSSHPVLSEGTSEHEKVNQNHFHTGEIWL